MSFPDSEALVVQFLRLRLGATHVGTKVPRDRPDVFVRVWRTGGASANRVLDQPLITVQAWGSDSHKLIERCRDWLLNDYTFMPPVRGIEEVSGSYYDPDPDTNIDRYTFTVQLRVRAHR